MMQMRRILVVDTRYPLRSMNALLKNVPSLAKLAHLDSVFAFEDLSVSLVSLNTCEVFSYLNRRYVLLTRIGLLHRGSMTHS